MSEVKQNFHLVPLWDAMMRGARKWAEDNSFVGVSGMPHIAGASGSCEDWNNTLAVADSEKFFGKPAFLVQSGQLYLEGLTHRYERVYCEIQSFRRETQVDNRHLVQFTLFEIEHLGDLALLMDNIEGILSSCIETSLPVLDEILPERAQELRNFLRKPLARMSYAEAVERLKEYFPDLEWGDDLKAHHELKIVELVGHGILLHTFPTHLKFWNMKAEEADGAVVKSCDLLLPFAGESAGAAERSTDYQELKTRLVNSEMYQMMIDQGVKDEEFNWYLDQHKTGEIKTHSGAGIGMARVAQFILGTDDIRNAVPFVLNRDSLL